MQGIADILHQQKGATAEIAHSIDNVAEPATSNEDLLGGMSAKLHRSNDRFSDNAKSWFKADSHRALCEMAKIDHVLFKKRVVDVVMGRGQWAANEMPDHHGCRLGRWYDAVSMPQIKALPAFAALVEPHRRVHAAGKAALTAHAAGDIDAALDALTDLNAASHEVLRLLEEMSVALNGDLVHTDRRRSGRVPVDRALSAVVDGERRTVTMRDVSASGARLEGLTGGDVGRIVMLDHGAGCCAGTAVWSDGRTGGVRFDPGAGTAPPRPIEPGSSRA